MAVWHMLPFTLLALLIAPAWAAPAPLPYDFNVPSYCQFLADLAATPGYITPQNTTLDVAADFVLKGMEDVPAGAWAKWNITDEAISTFLAQLGKRGELCSGTPPTSSRVFDFHPYDPAMDGPVAAPRSHTVAWRSPRVDVVHWTLSAQYQEPYHTHPLASLTFIVFPAGRTYYDSHGTATSSTGPYTGHHPRLAINCQEPEWLHSIHNTDTHTYQVIRVFFVPLTTSYMPHLD
eukprot:CAMPEP_0177665430 /NCGR_PEP_ID=MMETSP0447-20121125/21047_1 /TAXON_ID=0 /ORGANISM="Stygamoeba regulata, Strain BSH-02190019" /LENGTH=233 /DNA_ID=CAMNT_0019171517 /DNA_START=165 /DNA_END=866 /DNA_ORIENTATION=-